MLLAVIWQPYVHIISISTLLRLVHAILELCLPFCDFSRDISCFLLCSQFSFFLILIFSFFTHSTSRSQKRSQRESWNVMLSVEV